MELNIAFVSEKSITHSDVNQDNNCIVVLDEYWMKKTNNFLFRLSLDKVIEKILNDIQNDNANENTNENNKDKQDKGIKITQNMIIEEYKKLNPFFELKNILNMTKVIFNKPTYFVSIVTMILTLVCFVGKLFLYGYYFGSSKDSFTGLLSMCINPVPIDTYSSALIGLYFIIYTTVIWSINKFIDHKSGNKKKVFKIFYSAIAIGIMTFVTVVIFSDLSGRTSGFIIFTSSLYLIIPLLLLFCKMYVNITDFQPFNILLSSIISFFALIILMILLSNYGELVDLITLLSPFIFIIFTYMFCSLLNFLRKKISHEKSNIMDLEDKTQVIYSEYKNFTTRTIFSTIFFIPFVVIVIYFSCSLIYKTGVMYSDISIKHYNTIKINEEDERVYFGTIVGEKNNSIYISTMRKDLLVIKATNSIIESCGYFETDMSEKEFSEKIDMARKQIKQEIEDGYTIKFLPVNEISNNEYCEIIYPNSSCKLSIYYSTNYFKEIDAMHIILDATKEDMLEKKEIVKIKNLYLDCFNMNEVNKDNSEKLYNNGRLEYEIVRGNNKITESYTFKASDYFDN